MKKKILYSFVLGLFLSNLFYPFLVSASTQYEHALLSDEGSPIYGTNWQAQTFKAISTHNITSCIVKGYSYGTPTGNSYMYIYGTSAGSPSGSVLVTSSALDVSTIPTSPTISTFTYTFSSPYTVASGTIYALEISHTTGDTGNRLYWYGIYNNDAYTDGQAYGSTNSGSTWTSHTNDPNDEYFDCYGDAGGGGGDATSTATSTEAKLLLSLNFTMGIILVLIFVVAIAYIYSTITPKKPWK